MGRGLDTADPQQHPRQRRALALGAVSLQDGVADIAQAAFAGRAPNDAAVSEAEDMWGALLTTMQGGSLVAAALAFVAADCITYKMHPPPLDTALLLKFCARVHLSAGATLVAVIEQLQPHGKSEFVQAVNSSLRSALISLRGRTTGGKQVALAKSTFALVDDVATGISPSEAKAAAAGPAAKLLEFKSDAKSAPAPAPLPTAPASGGQEEAKGQEQRPGCIGCCR
jgi:hypothetical protein